MSCSRNTKSSGSPARTPRTPFRRAGGHYDRRHGRARLPREPRLPGAAAGARRVLREVAARAPGGGQVARRAIDLAAARHAAAREAAALSPGVRHQGAEQGVCADSRLRVEPRALPCRRRLGLRLPRRPGDRAERPQPAGRRAQGARRMTATVATVFAIVYVGMILGGLPFLQLDRTGVALLGAIAIVGLEVLTPEQAALSIHLPTLLLLFSFMVLSAVFSNDVVCLAVAPVLADACARRRLDPVPYLIGLACAANIGSAATLIGNPQNMLIGQ